MNKYLEKLAANPEKILSRIRAGKWGEGSKVFKGARNPKQSYEKNLERLYETQFKGSHKKPNFKKVMDARGALQGEVRRRKDLLPASRKGLGAASAASAPWTQAMWKANASGKSVSSERTKRMKKIMKDMKGRGYGGLGPSKR